MADKSLRVKLVIASLLEHNLNQQISHFRSFNSTRKVRSDENFGSSTCLTQWLGFFIIEISLKVYLLPCV